MTPAPTHCSAAARHPGPLAAPGCEGPAPARPGDKGGRAEGRGAGPALPAAERPRPSSAPRLPRGAGRARGPRAKPALRESALRPPVTRRATRQARQEAPGGPSLATGWGSPRHRQLCAPAEVRLPLGAARPPALPRGLSPPAQSAAHGEAQGRRPGCAGQAAPAPL